jgi:hypothetical protein
VVVVVVVVEVSVHWSNWDFWAPLQVLPK